MTQCKFHTFVDAHISQCELVGIKFAGISNPNHPCTKCMSEWINNQPPTTDNLTPTLKEIVQITTAVLVPPPQPPSLAEQLKTSTTALVQFVKSGGQLLSKEDTKTRLDICETCEHRKSSFLGNRCEACGCFLKVKAKLPNEHCPLRKWPNDPPAKDCGCKKS